MKDDLKYYRETPLGQQLNAHLKQRAQLRRSIPLFSFSLSKLTKRFEADTAPHDERLQHA